MNYHITGQGHLTAETPVAVSPPDHVDEIRRVLRLPRETVYRDGAPHRYPVIPASTFRGALRHAITGHAFETLNQAKGEKLFRVNDYIWTAQGGVTGKKDEGAEDFVEVSAPQRIRAQNPIMGIWGNFTFKMGSLLEMRSARAVDGEAAITLVPPQVRTDPMERDYALLGLIERTDLAAFKDELIARRMMVRAENQAGKLRLRLQEAADGKRALPPEEVKALKSEAKRLQTEAEALKEKAAGAVNLQQITARHEAVAAGSTLEHGWTLRDVSVEEAAVFMLSWSAWVANGSRLGALQRSGFGKLSGSYDILIKPARGPARLEPPQPAGRMTFSYEKGVTIESANKVMKSISYQRFALENGGFTGWNLKSE